MERLSHTIETDVFRTGSAPHAKQAAERIVARWWWALFIPLAIMTIYGIVADMRWLIITMAILLLFIPSATLIGYLGAIGNQDAVGAMFQRYVTFLPDGTIIVKIIKPVANDDASETRIAETQLIRPDRITSITLSGKHLQVRFDNASRNLLIPLSAFRDAESSVILLRAFGNHKVNS